MNRSEDLEEALLRRERRTGPLRPDLVLTGSGLIGVAEVRSGGSNPFVTISVTRTLDDGQLELIALLHQPAIGSDRQIASSIDRQWPLLVEMLQHTKGTLDLKLAQDVLTQDQISRRAIAHLETALNTSESLQELTKSNVVLETAILWRLLKQFGSFRPAEVISEVTGVKPRTINARLKLARDRGILPSVSRNDGQATDLREHDVGPQEK
jgi:hypothetical protein